MDSTVGSLNINASTQSAGQAQVAGVGDSLDSALRQLGNALEMARDIEDRILGPRPEEVAEGDAAMGQPHLRQTGYLLEERALELTQRLNRIASAL